MHIQGDRHGDRSARGGARPIGYWLKHLDRLIETNFDRTLGAQDLSRRHWQALNTLAQQPATHAELRSVLAPFLLDDPEAEARVSDELIRRGWVSAGDDERLSLTESGRTAQKTMLEQVIVARRRTVQGISDDEYVATVDVLQRMAANLEPG